MKILSVIWVASLLTCGVVAQAEESFSVSHADGQAPTNNSDLRMYVTPKFGYSLFTGIFGLEVQYAHIALDIGYFPSGGVRYYFKPRKHSWFAGLYGSGLGYDDDETKDGIRYSHYSAIEGGVGAGYRWLWRNRWNLELGATMGYRQGYFTNTYVKRTETSITFSPLLAVGFSF